MVEATTDPLEQRGLLPRRIASRPVRETGMVGHTLEIKYETLGEGIDTALDGFYEALPPS